MVESLVTEWMEEFEALTESEIQTYAAEQEHNLEIMIALFDVLSEPTKYKLDNVGVIQNDRQVFKYISIFR